MRWPRPGVQSAPVLLRYRETGFSWTQRLSKYGQIISAPLEGQPRGWRWYGKVKTQPRDCLWNRIAPGRAEEGGSLAAGATGLVVGLERSKPKNPAHDVLNTSTGEGPAHTLAHLRL